MLLQKLILVQKGCNLLLMAVDCNAVSCSPLQAHRKQLSGKIWTPMWHAASAACEPQPHCWLTLTVTFVCIKVHTPHKVTGRDMLVTVLTAHVTVKARLCVQKSALDLFGVCCQKKPTKTFHKLAMLTDYKRENICKSTECKRENICKSTECRQMLANPPPLLPPLL